MKKTTSLKSLFQLLRSVTVGGALVAAGLSTVQAQTTNALDVGANYANQGFGAPNGLSPGGQNFGYGFGPWTFTVNGNGGAFIQNYGPSGYSFDLWNVDGGGSTIAVRPFNDPLTPGQSFSVQLRFNNLDNGSDTNRMELRDAAGNTLFSYFHVGGDNADGHYTDAAGAGKATGFSYNYQQFVNYTFTLTSATTYTFADAATGATFSGTLAGAPALVAFVRVNGSQPTSNGQDFQFDGLQIVASDAPQFMSVTPVDGTHGVSVSGAIGLQIIPGSKPLNSASVAMQVDGAKVTPTVTTAQNTITVNYLPTPALSHGTAHTAQVVVQDADHNAFTNTWTFFTGFTALPVTLAGPFNVSGGNDLTLATAAGDLWLGNNYDASSGRTIYARFSMAFHDLNGKTDSGGGYGGLHFMRGDGQQLLIGNDWMSLNWSLDASGNQIDIDPATPIVLDEWHTFAVRIDFLPGANATAQIWLDPDFSQPETSQPAAPFYVTKDFTFDNLRLRCGNGTASATFSNIVLAATPAGVGFAKSASPQFLNFVPSQNAASAAVNTPISVGVAVGSVGIKTSAITLTVDGATVTPSFATANDIITVSYQPGTAFAPGSSHACQIYLTDDNGASYSASWNFTADLYPTLPLTQATDGNAINAGLGMPDTILYNAQNGWIGTNYGVNSTNTLYTRFTMTFYDLNGGNGAWGGLDFYQGNSERLLVGKNNGSTNWSVAAYIGGETDADLLPVTPIVLYESHVFVVKAVYAANAPTAVSIWLDPDFTQSEYTQPNPPLVLSMNNTFDTIRLRTGGGSAYSAFQDITVAATAPEVGFKAAPPPPGSLSLRATGGSLQLSWTGAGTLQSAPAVTGPWTDAASQANPQTLTPNGPAQFFRLKQ